MRRRNRRRPGVDERLPLELRDPPPFTHRVMEDLPVWRRWASARREWRRVSDPDRADRGYREDVSLPWLLMHERWGGMPPLVGGPTAADDRAAEWARTRRDRARP